MIILKNIRTRNDESGSLAIEAMIALVVFMLLFFVFLSFGQYTKTQNAVKHSLNQTVLTMSMVNNQRSWVQNLIKTGIGINATDVVSFIALFDEGTAQSVGVNLGQPYTTAPENLQGEAFYVYSTTAIETDILKYFTYYMCVDKSWDEINGTDTEALRQLLKHYNIKEIDFNTPEETKLATGATSTGYIGKSGTAKTITVSITYTIDAPFAFTGFFIRDPESAKGPKFTDKQTFVLID